MERNKIIFVKEYSCTLQELWEALTKPEAIYQWLDGIANYELKQGGEFTYEIEGEILKCEVKEVFLYHKLVYSMKFPNTTNNSTITFMFNAMNNPKYSQLTLKHKKINALPQNNEVFSKENLELEWKKLLEENLFNYIKNTNS